MARLGAIVSRRAGVEVVGVGGLPEGFGWSMVFEPGSFETLVESISLDDPGRRQRFRSGKRGKLERFWCYTIFVKFMNYDN